MPNFDARPVPNNFWYLRKNMFPEKTFFALWMFTKWGNKDFWNLIIGLSSHYVTSTGSPALQAGFDGPCQLGLRTTMYDFQKFVLPKNIFLPGIYFATGIRNRFCLGCEINHNLMNFTLQIGKSAYDSVLHFYCKQSGLWYIYPRTP